MAGGGIPPLRFADGGSTSDPYNNPSLYPDLWNTWGSSAQDTYDRVVRLLTSPEYKDWYNSLATPTQAYAVPYYSNPNDPDLLYRAQQEMQNWEAFQGQDPWSPPPPPPGGGGGGGGTTPPPGGGGTTPPPGGGGGGGGTTPPPPGGGGTTPPPGGGNWGGGGGQQNPYNPQPGYTPPEFPNLAFGYPWIPEELKALRAQLGLVPGGGGIPTEPPAVSTAGAKAGGIMSLARYNR